MILISVLLGALLLPGPARAQSGEGFAVAGRVTDTGGSPVRGVTLAVRGTGITTTTDADGRWRLSGLQGPVMLVPSKPGRTFFPASRLVSGPSADLNWQALTNITGDAVASLEQARAWLQQKAPGWEDMADLYYAIAPRYGIRPDVALAQACKETACFRFGGLIRPRQNNFAGLGATGVPSDGSTPLMGADPARVWYQEGYHGPFFLDRETGVEAHVQHLYAYATTLELPAGSVPLSPRLPFVRRGGARFVEHLGVAENPAGVGWAYPGHNYGKSIVWNYLEDMLGEDGPVGR